MVIENIEMGDMSRGSRRRIASAVGVVLALALAISASFGASLATSPAAALSPALARFGPGPLGRLKAQRVDLKKGASPQLALLARQALAVAPLSFEPFFAAALPGSHGITDFGGPRAAALLREAIRRDPRSTDARALLLQNALAGGRLDEAIDQLAVLNQLGDALGARLMDGLAANLNTASQAREVVAALKRHPELYRGFLGGMRKVTRDSGFVHTVVAAVPPATLMNPEVRALAIDQLISVNDFVGARQIASGRATATGQLLDSSDFASTAIPPPFGWSLAANEKGAAEYDSGALSVVYYGREAGQLAAKLLTLAPGKYQLSIDYISQSGTPGAIGLTVTCTESLFAAANVPLTGRIGIRQTQRVAIAVPAGGCGGQWLKLVGLPTEERVDEEMRIFSLKVLQAS